MIINFERPFLLPKTGIFEPAGIVALFSRQDNNAMKRSNAPCSRHWLPSEVLGHAVYLYRQFTLKIRDREPGHPWLSQVVFAFWLTPLFHLFFLPVVVFR